jgi:hypothetical protein
VFLVFFLSLPLEHYFTSWRVHRKHTSRQKRGKNGKKQYEKKTQKKNQKKAIKTTANNGRRAEEGQRLMQIRLSLEDHLEPILGNRFTANATFAPSPSSPPMHSATHRDRGG